MSFQFAKPTGGSSFFKPGDHMNDLALLVEAKSIAKNRPHTYQGRTSTRDEVMADITVFGTLESLEKGQPTAVLKNVKVAHAMLCSDLEDSIGQPFLGVVRKTPTAGGSGYVFRPVDPTTEGQVAGYYQQREAAITAAVADAPSFD
ncbi:hypothetical protein [Micromonospora sp. CB01531]|uniref:hypothetical protein n=1 Tax=Micromonospora sp. CB01531 TaxID=1718947 RepID=UPI00093BB6F7|nr:hypothetical protein [Micromonospora sp. CB01531]OKI45127.1 hypothetical protein A6A27_11990 [Micromonospora sp. CB01531]